MLRLSTLAGAFAFTGAASPRALALSAAVEPRPRPTPRLIDVSKAIVEKLPRVGAVPDRSPGWAVYLLPGRLQMLNAPEAFSETSS